jgi:hypothetical protein
MRASNASLGLAFAVACSLAACGGTSSETPWPVEPDDVDLGPAGELQRGPETRTSANPRPADAPSAPARTPANPTAP